MGKKKIIVIIGDFKVERTIEDHEEQTLKEQAAKLVSTKILDSPWKTGESFPKSDIEPRRWFPKEPLSAIIRKPSGQPPLTSTFNHPSMLDESEMKLDNMPKSPIETVPQYVGTDRTTFFKNAKERNEELMKGQKKIIIRMASKSGESIFRSFPNDEKDTLSINLKGKEVILSKINDLIEVSAICPICSNKSYYYILKCDIDNEQYTTCRGCAQNLSLEMDEEQGRMVSL